MTKEEKSRVQDLRRLGERSSAIARELGIPLSTIVSFCRDHDKDESVDYCPQCGSRLIHITGHKKKKFCSDKCRMLWWNSHPEQVTRRAYYKAVCKNCGREFWSYGNDHRIFCSRKCASESMQRDR